MMQSMMTSFKRCLGMDFSDQASREIKDAGRDNARPRSLQKHRLEYERCHENSAQQGAGV
jgi:hypothetical protein